MKSSSRREEALTFDRSDLKSPGGLSLLTSAATHENYFKRSGLAGRARHSVRAVLDQAQRARTE
jgi:hypothetical protein